jgi:hypothetical protein
MGSGTIGIDADPFVSHEGRPEPGQHRELQRDGDDEVADEAVLGGLHSLMGIKTHATRRTGKELF